MSKELTKEDLMVKYKTSRVYRLKEGDVDGFLITQTLGCILVDKYGNYIEEKNIDDAAKILKSILVKHH